jgi:hypothetical protein
MSIKDFILGNRHDLTQDEVALLKKHKSVTLNGIVYLTKDLLNRACGSCCLLKQQVKALEIQLEGYKVPKVEPVEVLMSNFFYTNYEPTRSRFYSRKALFNEVSNYMRQYNIFILSPMDSRYREFLKHIVKDKSKNYLKLKIKKCVLTKKM